MADSFAPHGAVIICAPGLYRGRNIKPFVSAEGRSKTAGEVLHFIEIYTVLSLTWLFIFTPLISGICLAYLFVSRFKQTVHIPSWVVWIGGICIGLSFQAAYITLDEWSSRNDHGNIKEFSQKYPSLRNYFAGNFPPGEFDFDSEEDVIEHTVEPGCEELVAEGREMLLEEPFPWRELARVTSHWFRNSEEAHAWLSYIIDLMEKAIREAPDDDLCAGK